MKKIFISYSHKDTEIKDGLVKHLYPFVLNKQIEIWEDGLIEAGDSWDNKIKKNLDSADIVLLLVSSDALTSKYINNVELKRAMIKHNKNLIKVVPVIARPCKWEILPISKIQAMPNPATPISKWEDKDEAFLNIANELERII